MKTGRCKVDGQIDKEDFSKKDWLLFSEDNGTAKLGAKWILCKQMPEMLVHVRKHGGDFAYFAAC